MKKNILIIGISILVVAVVVFVIMCLNRVTYKIEVRLVDNQSPDRILTVYDSKNKRVEVKRIEFLDGTLLCKGYNTTVHYGDIMNVSELKIVLKDNKEVKAKIIKGEVKK